MPPAGVRGARCRMRRAARLPCPSRHWRHGFGIDRGEDSPRRFGRVAVASFFRDGCARARAPDGNRDGGPQEARRMRRTLGAGLGPATRLWSKRGLLAGRFRWGEGRAGAEKWKSKARFVQCWSGWNRKTISLLSPPDAAKGAKKRGFLGFWRGGEDNG
jgi:hypothetical protein